MREARGGMKEKTMDTRKEKGGDVTGSNPRGERMKEVEQIIIMMQNISII